MGLLVAAQSLGGASPPIIISLGGLVGQQLSTNPTASTLPVSIYQLGLALSTPPGRLWWGFDHQARRSFGRNTQGLPAAPSVMGVRICADRSAALA